MTLTKFLGFIMKMIESRANESVLSDDDVKKSCAGQSGLRASLKSSKKKFDEFFKSKTYDLQKQCKKNRLDEDEENGIHLVSTSSLNRKKLKADEFLTPVLSVKKFEAALQKSINENGSPPKNSKERFDENLIESMPVVSNSFRRQTSYWRESTAKCDLGQLNRQQLDRQEAIFELFQGEVDMVQDLQMICSNYRDSMKKLKLLNDEEITSLFGGLDLLLPLHRELAENLSKVRLPDGRTEDIGSILLDWVPKLAVYVLYCTNQIFSKDLFDRKMKGDEAFRDFLERCLACPFSRKLDLWTFLDSPRSRLVKYPLLLKNILKLTDQDHLDCSMLIQSIDVMEEIVRDVDFNVGLTRCHHVVNKFDYEDVKQMHPFIEESSLIICDGILRNRRGLKLHVFLLDKILVLTKPVTTRNNSTRYKVYRKPLPLCNLFLVENQSIQSTPRGPTYVEATKSHLGHHNRKLLENSKDSAKQSAPNCESATPKTSLSFKSVLSSFSNPRRTSLSSSSTRSSSGSESLIELVSLEESCNFGRGQQTSKPKVRKCQHVLRAEDELGKQHWIQCLRQHIGGFMSSGKRSSIESESGFLKRSFKDDSGLGKSDNYCSSPVLYRRRSSLMKFEKRRESFNPNDNRCVDYYMSAEADKSILFPQLVWDQSISSYSSFMSVYSSDSHCGIKYNELLQEADERSSEMSECKMNTISKTNEICQIKEADEGFSAASHEKTFGCSVSCTCKGRICNSYCCIRGGREGRAVSPLYFHHHKN